MTLATHYITATHTSLLQQMQSTMPTAVCLYIFKICYSEKYIVKYVDKYICCAENLLNVMLIHDLIPRVFKFCFEEWQDIWNCCLGNKHHAMYPVVGTAQHNKIRSRRETPTWPLSPNSFIFDIR